MKVIKKLTLDKFVGPDSKSFFDILEINTSFMEKPVLNWTDDVNYIEALNITKSLISVNESAERAVKIAEYYNGELTESWDQYEMLCINKHAFNLERRK